jgi:hypothetical protein
MSTFPSNIVIVGGGIIGLGAAFYLATDPGNPPANITIVDNALTLLQSCSGAANGGNGPGDSTKPLCELNYALLTKLKKEYQGYERWCHRTCRTVKVVRREGGQDGEDGRMPGWLARLNDDYKVVQLGDTFEHIFPRLFCEFLIARCEEAGVVILPNTEVVDVLTTTERSKTSLQAVCVKPCGGPNADMRTIDCQRLLLSAGAWTPHLLRRLFPATRIDIPLADGPPSLHWLNVRDPGWTPDQASEGASQVLFEEVFGFPLNLTNYSNGVIFVGQRSVGRNHVGDPGYLMPGKDDEGLPKDVSEVKINPHSNHTMRVLTARALGLESERELDVVREGRGYYSVPGCARPISTQLSGYHLGWDEEQGHESGVLISLGHESGCSYALGNGMVLSEIILGKKLSGDLTEFAIPDEYVK